MSLCHYKGLIYFSKFYFCLCSVLFSFMQTTLGSDTENSFPNICYSLFCGLAEENAVISTSPSLTTNVRWFPPGCLRWLWPRGGFFSSFSVVVDVFAGLYGLFFGLSPETVVLLQRKSNKQTNKKFKNSTLSLSHHLSLLNPSSSSTACWTSGSH